VLVESEDVVTQWSKSLQKLSASRCQDIIFLPRSYVFQRTGYCNQSGEVFLLFDDFVFPFKEEIKNRRQINRAFPEPFIWELLYKLVLTEKFMENNHITIGNVNPSNIIANEEGELRLISKYSWPETECFTFDLTGRGDELCSPEKLS
jgi:hypothetical protein